MGGDRFAFNVPLGSDDLEIVAAAAFESPYGLAIWQGDPDNPNSCDLTLRFINKVGAGPRGKDPVDLFNLPMTQALPEVVGTPIETAIREVLQRGGTGEVVARSAQPGQEARTFRNNITLIAEGLVMATFEEITHELFLEREHQIERRTNLATRSYFDDLFQKVIEERAVDRGPVGMLFIDLDKFKLINDTYGHICGDEILSEVARRLRMLEPQPRLIARWGGDEFAILTRWSAQRNREFAGVILRAFEKPIVWGTEVIQVNLSIGVATSTPGEALNARRFVIAVDRAMYEAKELGGGLFIEVRPADV